MTRYKALVSSRLFNERLATRSVRYKVDEVTRSFTLRALGICLGSLVCGFAYGQTASPATEPATPRVYALVAAIGDQFTTVTAVQTVGSHLSPYRRSTSDVPNNVLNRFALHSLDKAIEAVEPTSTRIYLSVPAASMNGVAP